MSLRNGEVKISDIIKKTLEAIEKSRSAIFDIAETSRREVEALREEIKRLQTDVKDIIAETDRLELALRRSMVLLANINRDFTKHTQEEMKQAYEAADKLRVDLAVNREREKQGIQRRNDLERRLKSTIETVNKAEQVVVQVGAALNYLSGDLSSLGEQMESADNKRLLAMKIIRAHEEERSRISREIHDGPAQAMSNVVLKAEIVEKLFDVDIEKTRAELANLKVITRNSLQDVRRIIYDLRPMSLDDLGLRPTLTKYLEGYARDFGIETELKFRGDLPKLDNKNLELTVFRTIQECLSNVRKHAQATHVGVTVEYAPKAILLRVKDNGQGFDTRVLSEVKLNESGGFGLFGMRERLDLLDGTVEIDSTPGQGTTVRVMLPYEAREA